MDANPTITFSKNENEISNTILKFDEVVTQIESRKYNKKCDNKKLCKNCDLRYYCRRNEE